MECSDRCVPPTLRAVPWLRRLELRETNLETADLRVANLEETNSEIVKQELCSGELRNETPDITNSRGGAIWIRL